MMLFLDETCAFQDVFCNVDASDLLTKHHIEKNTSYLRQHILSTFQTTHNALPFAHGVRFPKSREVLFNLL